MQGEIRLFCKGNSTPASRLVPIGVGVVDRLREVDSYGFQSIQVSDTERIEVRLNGGSATITIWEDGDEIKQSCPSYQSGMTQYGALIGKNDSTSGGALFGLWAFSPSSAYSAKNNLAAGWQVGKYGRAPATELSGYPSFPAYADTSIPASWNEQGWSQCALLKPGLYSGRMRQAVQILLGSNIGVQYDYRFSRTHGIYRTTINGNPADWLVEISSANGVIAMLMPKCTSSVPPENTLGHVPAGKSFPAGVALDEAIKSGTVRQLMSVNDLSDVYGKRAFSPLFGWAFNYSGTKASVVVYDQPGKYKNTYLFSISFSGDSSGPSGAILYLEKSGTVVCDKTNAMGYVVGMFKVPMYAGGASYPVDFGPAFGIYSPDACSAPLHVWYNQANEQKLVMYKNGIVEHKRPTDERRIGGRGIDEPKPADRDWMDNEGNLNQLFVEYGDGPAGDHTEHANQQFYVQGFEPQRDQASPVRTTYKASASGGYVHRLTTFGSEFPSGGIVIANSKLLRLWTEAQSGYFRRTRTAVIIPSFEREAALSCEVNTWNTTLTTKTHFTYSVSIRQAYYEGVDRPSDGWFNHMDDDWLPNAGGAVLVSDTGSIHGISPFPITEGPINNGLGIGGWVKEGYGGFGAGYGSSEMPNNFNWRDGWPLLNSDLALSSSMPLSLSEDSYGKFYRTTVKQLHCESGIHKLKLNTLPPADNFENADTFYEPDSAWFNSLEYPIYTLIQSWNGDLRFSPPKLNSYSFSMSLFGGYEPHAQAREGFINFVGDA